MRILCVCLSANIQRTIRFDSLSINAVNRSVDWREDASGKALNAARVLNQLEPGSSVALCPVGNANAERFLRLAADDGNLSVTPIYIDGNTRECWTLLDEKTGTTTELIADMPQNPAQPAGAEAELRLLDSVRGYMTSFDALLLAGSRPAIWSKNICARICEIAYKAGKIVLTDFRGEDLLATIELCPPSIIKINEEEFCQTFGKARMSEEELSSEIARKSVEFQNIIVVTRGGEQTFSAEKGKFYSCPTEKISPLNTTGCGDAFAAGFLYSYLKSKDIEAALKMGNHCGALNARTFIPGSLR